jgi:hypothetical protein
MVLDESRRRNRSEKWSTEPMGDFPASVPKRELTDYLKSSSFGILAAPYAAHADSAITPTNVITVAGIVVAAAVAIGIERWRKKREARVPLTGAEIADLNEYLKIGERIVVQFGDADVLTAAELTQLRIRELIDGARGIAGRGGRAINRAAADLAAAATEVMKAAMPEDKDVIAAYRTPDPGGIPTTLHPRSLVQMGIRQDRAIRDLRDKIGATWKILREDEGHSTR